MLGYVITTPIVEERFTEFYILGIEGKAENYPQQLCLGEEGKVIVGIVNHQHKETQYRLEVMMGGEKLYELPPIRLKPGGKWEEMVGFTPSQIGDNQKVEFLLYKGKGQPFEVRYLWVDVKA